MVNTFITSLYLPNTFKKLDFRRLGKQRLEAKQLIDILKMIDNGEDVSNVGFSSHPVTQMWIGYTNALKAYYNLCLQEWIDRGYNNTMKKYDIDETKFINREVKFDGIKTTFISEDTEYSFPPFASFKPFILTHKAALYKKDPNFYAGFLNDELEPYVNLGYLWPTHYGNIIYEKWELKYIHPPGSGVPVQYRITENEARSWILNKLKNPKTNRSIKKDGPKYKEYHQAATHYNLL